METSRRIRKITLSTGIVVMTVGLFNSFDLKADDTGAGGDSCPPGYTKKPAKKVVDNYGTIIVYCPIKSTESNTTCCVKD